jgi:DNA-binding NarL/FixJ family response regulator
VWSPLFFPRWNNLIVLKGPANFAGSLTEWSAVKLLIVDNHAAVRRVIRSVVAHMLLEIQECPSAADAALMYRALLPDYAVMAFDLRGMGGIEITRTIRGSHPEAKIVLVADYDDRALREEARTAGACGYLLKEDLFKLPGLLTNCKGKEK